MASRRQQSKPTKVKRSYRKKRPVVIDGPGDALPVDEFAPPMVPEVVIPQFYWPEAKPGQYYVLSYDVPGSSFQIDGHVLKAGEPMVTQNPYGLSCGWLTLCEIPGLSLELVDSLDEVKRVKPAPAVAKRSQPVEQISKDGVVWEGATAYRTTAYGQFKKGEPVFGLSDKAVEELTYGGSRFRRIAR